MMTTTPQLHWQARLRTAGKGAVAMGGGELGQRAGGGEGGYHAIKHQMQPSCAAPVDSAGSRTVWLKRRALT